MEPEIEEPDELIEDGNVESMVQVIEQEGAPLSPPLQSRDLGSPEPPLHIHGDPVRIPSQVGATAVNEGNMNQRSQELEEELVSVRSEVATLRAALSSEPSKQKLADLEAEKRDLLAVVSQLQSDNSMLEDQSDANAEARSKAQDTVRDLEQRLSTQTDSERSTRLQLQQAQSQVTLLQQDRYTVCFLIMSTLR